MKQGGSGGPADSRTLLPAAADSVALQLFLLLSLIGLLCTEAVASGRTPGEQLARMADALQSLSYEGTIVYLHGNRLEALRIIHRVEEGQVHEQLVSLTGPVRTLTREKGGVTCKLSDSHPLWVKGQGIGNDVLRAWTLDPGAPGVHYRIDPLGSARVAGRQTEVVGVIPRDHLRYGYRFYLDRDSGLPLKSDLMGPRADPIEQVMFTSLDLLPSQGPSPGVASLPPQQRRASVQRLVPGALPWRFDALPPGFVLVKHENWRDGGDQPVEQYLLSDGLASVSVYVESNPQEGLKGGTRIGAFHATGNRVSGHQITVVGEVPLETVERVLEGIRHVPGGPHD